MTRGGGPATLLRRGLVLPLALLAALQPGAALADDGLGTALDVAAVATADVLPVQAVAEPVAAVEPVLAEVAAAPEAPAPRAAPAAAQASSAPAALPRAAAVHPVTPVPDPEPLPVQEYRPPPPQYHAAAAAPTAHARRLAAVGETWMWHCAGEAARTLTFGRVPGDAAAVAAGSCAERTPVEAVISEEIFPEYHADETLFPHSKETDGFPAEEKLPATGSAPSPERPQASPERTTRAAPAALPASLHAERPVRRSTTARPTPSAAPRARARELRPAPRRAPSDVTRDAAVALTSAGVAPLGAGEGRFRLPLALLAAFVVVFADATRRVTGEVRPAAAESGRRLERPG